MPVVSGSMPTELLERLDALAEEYDYTGRSEVVREGVRTLLSEFDDERLESRPLAATVSVVSAFGARGDEHRIAALRHEHEELLVSTFVGGCRVLEGVEAVECSLVPLDDVGQRPVD
ncbi:CopG family ribbon-helix-helix protein [Natrarchaeobaculum sulfurireducens]|uniref:Nickel responsive regulator NikR n=1 Tax=Natrarchaeobaculum sulfurireducens TaxID=2044521 RepID=A0A346PKW4_9EURY|nr:nickel-responsive transcriptional regulator NikR [Natrarchaeobaculum sulfurireducens]AXR76483.1 Transcriptional regulator, CopG/Arc/MetJ family (DNA-binding and a metal-binding domains) [Natrarchaeobaculum sulfurireducens]AXR80159.1 Nickel responsive regulator NikR [Natrarchaeobaculum sulfurireducens]